MIHGSPCFHLSRVERARGIVPLHPADSLSRFSLNMYVGMHVCVCTCVCMYVCVYACVCMCVRTVYRTSIRVASSVYEGRGAQRTAILNPRIN